MKLVQSRNADLTLLVISVIAIMLLMLEFQSAKIFIELFFSLVFLFIFILLGLSYLKSRIQEQLSNALEFLDNGVIHFDAKGDLVYFNPAAASMLPDLVNQDGSTNFIGTYKKFLSFIYDRSLDLPNQSRLQLNISEINAPRFLFREVVKLGKEKIALVQFYEKESKQITVMLTDISMMKKHVDTIAAVREENEILIRAIESSEIGMFIVSISDCEEAVIHSNHIVNDLLDKSRKDIVGMSFQALLRENFLDQMDDLNMAINLAKLEKKPQNIWLHVTRRNRTIWYHFQILFFSDDTDNDFFVCFLSNQTEARMAQAEIDQTQRLEFIGKLAGNVAHDINNLLSIMDGYLKIAKNEISKGRDVSILLENMDKNIRRGSHITQNLLFFRKPSVKNKVRLDVGAHLTEFERFLKQVTDYDIKLVVSVQETPFYADVAPDTLNQIILILAANAREAMLSGGDLIISGSEASTSQILSFPDNLPKDKNFICLQVIDSGSGMDAETLSRIYEPFFTTKDSTRNSGLRMSIVYGLVKELEGFIDIRSTIDVGTSISILIPAVSTEHAFERSDPIPPKNTVAQPLPHQALNQVLKSVS